MEAVANDVAASCDEAATANDVASAVVAEETLSAWLSLISALSADVWV